MFRVFYYKNKMENGYETFLDDTPELKYGVFTAETYETYETYDPHRKENQTYSQWRAKGYPVTSEEELDKTLREIMNRDKKLLAVHKDD